MSAHSTRRLALTKRDALLEFAVMNLTGPTRFFFLSSCLAIVILTVGSLGLLPQVTCAQADDDHRLPLSLSEVDRDAAEAECVAVPPERIETANTPDSRIVLYRLGTTACPRVPAATKHGASTYCHAQRGPPCV